MLTRTVIVLLHDRVILIDEYTRSHRSLNTSRQRVYMYSKISFSSFQRLISLTKAPQATIRLITDTPNKDYNALIYWKREQMLFRFLSILQEG